MTDDSRLFERLAGTVERVTFHNEENGFSVLKVRVRGRKDPVAVVGHVPTIAAGEKIDAEGQWMTDKVHGLQFRASFLQSAPPASAEGIEKYLSSGLIRGIGPIYARKLIAAFGDVVFEVIEAEPERLRTLKRLINGVVAEVERDAGNQGRMGVLIDGRPGIGEAALHDATGRGWWIGRPIELPGSRPLRFDGTDSLASQLRHWPASHTVKCLVFYHPGDSEALRREQDEWLRQVWAATRASGHELLLEVIPPQEMLAEGDQGESVVASIRHFYDIGLKPEWWKVGAMSSANWQVLDALVQARDPWCRGAVILGLSQPVAQLVEAFAQASAPVVKGFMIGRSVWSAPALRWLRGEIGDQAFQAAVAANFRELIAGWDASRPAEGARQQATAGALA